MARIWKMGVRRLRYLVGHLTSLRRKKPSHHARRLLARFSYDSEGDQKDAPSAYRVKRIGLGSLDRVPMVPVPPAPTPYLDPPSPSLRPSTHTRTHASKPA